MGFNLNKAREKKEEIIQSFTPLDLNEGNVQAIFNRCLAKPDSKEILPTSPFPVITGYSAKNNKVVDFDDQAILSNKKNIEYLFGQLQTVHEGNSEKRATINDFTTTYSKKSWTDSKAHLLELLYLSVTPNVHLIRPFSFRDNNTTTLRTNIKPTLSPKDPNFPAWWEEHKAEWEEPKKEGKEPADD